MLRYAAFARASGLSDPKQLYTEMIAKMDSLAAYRVEYQDVIRKRNYEFFQKIDPDGFKETANVFRGDPNHAELTNRQGKWLLTDEAVKLDFESSDNAVKQDTVSLMRLYPGDIVFKFPHRKYRVV